MSIDCDETLDLARARTVRLGGRDWFIAPLSLRQIIAIADFVPKLSALSNEQLSSERLVPLAEVLWHGLRRAHPRLTRDEFLDLPITITELIAALPVVIEQAGGQRVDAEAGGNRSPEDVPAGEAGAASASIPSTGARSSPNW